MGQAPPAFARDHIADLAFDRVELEGCVAIFYAIAGQSLHHYRPLASYQRQSKLEAIFSATNEFLLAGWNAALTFEQALHPQELLARWLGYRLQPGGNIERFLEDGCHIHPDTAGLLIQGQVFPNPLVYARESERWGAVRAIDAIVGFQHGDLNIGNILTKFNEDGMELAGYYLIDFALFKAQMPLLYDQRYLEMSYLIRELARAPFPKWVDFVTRFADGDMVDPHQVPIELAGACAVIDAGRRAFGDWVGASYPSLYDDLWGQFWLAAVAAGLNYCNKAMLPERERLAGLIFAAAHLKRYHATFGVSAPVEIKHPDMTPGGGERQPGESPRADAVTRSPNGRPNHNLPVQLTDFVGRQRELIEVGRLLSEARLLTLTGPGGIGKTRLAIQAAGQQVESFRNGVYFVPLAPIDSADFIVQTIAETMGFPLSTRDDPKDQLLNYLHNKQMLLVLDNFEHLLDGARLVSEILKGAAGVKILATSRERLNLVGESVCNITGLDYPDWEVLEDALSYSAVQLFVQSAQRSRPDFALDAENLESLDHILKLAQGMPLGIELAAAWVNMFSLEEIAGEISQSLDFLESELRDIPDRHRSIRAVFDTSWKHLTPAERALFKTLSVFRGGFTREAAQQVAGASLRMLAGLVNKSLLIRDSDTRHYEVHELLRQYAEEELRADPQARVGAQEAHAAYYADFMEQSWKHLTDNRMKGALDKIERDIENIRTAWRYWVRKGDATQIGKFVNSFWAFYEVVGWYRSAVDLFGASAEALRSASGGAEAENALAQALALEAWFTNLLGFPERGLRLAKESVDILQRLNHREDLFLPFQSLCLNAVFLNRGEEIKKAAPEQLEITKEKADKWMEAMSLVWMCTGFMVDQDFSVRAPGRPTVRVYYVFEARIQAPDLIRMMLANSQRYSDQDLQNMAWSDAQGGGKGRANAILVLGLDDLKDAYRSIPAEGRGGPVSVGRQRLDGNVLAILEEIDNPKYQLETTFALTTVAKCSIIQ